MHMRDAEKVHHERREQAKVSIHMVVPPEILSLLAQLFILHNPRFQINKSKHTISKTLLTKSINQHASQPHDQK